ncbi:Eco57I restriction-modification methylase domain-containing protein [Sulfurimonas sp.]|uniref:Eco57I restriction-modification methylase domain-containing protein n=1 Tax=Sulfurimonas sp. TaxID=2022749 RepID=UPI0019E6221A|nr:Eco57I restriction-modification methylase domain-containing protein [Sulfurimonas sp.]MBE0513918.1 Eco57I restriction-modification methylase domain-containing protein [Sulfurimonas sp.]
MNKKKDPPSSLEKNVEILNLTCMILNKIFDKRLNPALINKEKSKKLGQYFTSITIAEYMTKMILPPENKKIWNQIRILDAGAGEGILGVAAVLHCISMGYKNIHLTAYEIDEELVQYLQTQIEKLYEFEELNDIILEFEIHCKDFVLNRPDQDKTILPFDICIINPPYFKYSVKDSLYSKATSDLYKGDPNIYASIMAICLSSLTEHGQLVAIIPRSFTNGLYFKGFRQYLSAVSSLDRIHIFQSRDKVFKDSNVLQENIICKLTKGKQKQKISITSSYSNKDISNENGKSYDNAFIFDTSYDLMIIHIPETESDAYIMQQANQLKNTFSNSGYYISTGPIVEHRTREYIVDGKSIIDNTVPLLRPHNVQLMTASWSGKHKKDVTFRVVDGSSKHLLTNNVYVLLKRFSSKDEKKRLTAGVYKPNNGSELVGFGNKLNYIGVQNSLMNFEEALGVAAVFNSTFMDSYFRCLSGNTQVNATEIRVMKFPSRDIVKSIGKKLVDIEVTQETLDRIVLKYLFKG